jgi:hypothetical protein
VACDTCHAFVSPMCKDLFVRANKTTILTAAAVTAAAVGVSVATADPASARRKPRTPAAAPAPSVTPSPSATPSPAATPTPTATAQAPQATSVTVGLYAGTGSTGGTAAVASFGSWLGKPVVWGTDYIDPFGSYYPTQLQSWSTWRAQAADRRFVLGLPMLPGGGSFGSGAAGAYDASWRGVASTLVAKGLADTVIRLGYEGNNCGIGPWQACDDPAGYAAMFRHVVDVMRAVPGQHFVFDFDSATGFPSGRKLTGYADYYPGDAWVDVVGQNFYDVWWDHQTATPEQRWANLVNQDGGLAAHRAFAAAHGKPVSFDEWGLYAHDGDTYAGGGDSPYFIGQARAWFAESGPMFQSYFNTDWGGGTMDWFPNAKAEYRTKFGAAG